MRRAGRDDGVEGGGSGGRRLLQTAAPPPSRVHPDDILPDLVPCSGDPSSDFTTVVSFHPYIFMI